MLPFEGIKRADEGFQMASSRTGLVTHRHVDWRAHLVRYRRGHVRGAFLIHRQDGTQHLAALGRGGQGPAGKSPAGRRDRRFGIGRPTKRNGGIGFFGRRIVDRKIGSLARRHPGPVDIEVAHILHAVVPNGLPVHPASGAAAGLWRSAR